MSKVVVVERCAYCPYLWWSKSGKICRRNYNDIESLGDIPDWCLLPDLPEKRNAPEVFGYTLGEPLTDETSDILTNIGWDDCIDTILHRRETEND